LSPSLGALFCSHFYSRLLSFSSLKFRSSCRLLSEGVPLFFTPPCCPPFFAVYLPFVYSDFINHTPRVLLHDKRVFRCRWQDSLSVFFLSVKLLQRIGNITDIDDYIEIVQKSASLCVQMIYTINFKMPSTAPLLFLGDCIMGWCSVTQDPISTRVYQLGTVMTSAI